MPQMAFSNAIPLNRIAYGEAAGFSMKSRQQWQPRSGDGAPRQSVNISEETMLKIARDKLSRAVGHKLSYNRSGAFAEERPVGQLLSAKA